MSITEEHTYIAIDLKSFYASVECLERKLDPLDTNLVVADESRTDKTICLAVTPSLKAYGISGRARLFEVRQKIREANIQRRAKAPGGRFTGTSSSASALAASPELGIDFMVAPPRMAHYMKCSSRIYEIYMKYIAPEDMVVYSIDEVFMDVTHYLATYKLSPQELARKIILDVLKITGITATAGIGTNLFLCKVAWTSWQSTSRQTKTACGLPSLMRWSFAVPSGDIVLSRISGGWAGAMPLNWKNTACLPWGTSPTVL